MTIRSDPRLLAAATLGALLALAPAPARGQDARSEARARFAHAVDLFDEGQLDAALAEFERAYQLVPNAAVLYDVAQVHAALGHAVEAVDVFERYLREGGDGISAERRDEVERELARQRARIARVTVDVPVPGAIVALDDADVGPAPLDAPLRVSAGEHVISARAPGYEPARRRVRVLGGTEPVVRVEMIESSAPRGSLRIVGALPGVEVTIDDRALGLTPFDGPIALAPGAHRLRARREGYLPIDRRVEVEVDAEQRVEIALERDPALPAAALGELTVVVPRGALVLSVDGEALSGESRTLRLPEGPHAITVELARRRPWTGRADVERAGASVLRPELEWTPEGRDARHAEIDQLLVAGGVMTGVGAALLAVGIPLWVWSQDGWARLGSELRQVEAACDTAPPPMPACDPLLRSLGGYVTVDEWLDEHNRQRQIQVAIDWTAAIAMGLGAAVAVAGIVVLIATPSHGGVDREAYAASRRHELRVELRVGPGGLSLRGAI